MVQLEEVTFQCALQTLVWRGNKAGRNKQPPQAVFTLGAMGTQGAVGFEEQWRPHFRITMHCVTRTGDAIHSRLPVTG